MEAMPVILGRGKVCAEEKELTQRAQRKKAQRARRRERRRREKNGSEDPPLQRIAEGANREIGVPRRCGVLRSGERKPRRKDGITQRRRERGEARSLRKREMVMVWGAGL